MFNIKVGAEFSNGIETKRLVKLYKEMVTTESGDKEVEFAEYKSGNAKLLTSVDTLHELLLYGNFKQVK